MEQTSKGIVVTACILGVLLLIVLTILLFWDGTTTSSKETIKIEILNNNINPRAQVYAPYVFPVNYHISYRDRDGRRRYVSEPSKKSPL